MHGEYFAEPHVEVEGEGDGWQETITVANPGAGAGVTYRNEGQYVSRPKIVTFTLVTSAAAATRVPHVQFRDGNSVPIADALGSTVPASFTTVFCFSVDYGYTAVTNGVTAVGSLPDYFLQPSEQIAILVSAIDAADQISNVRITVDRFNSRGRHRPRHHRRRLWRLREVHPHELGTQFYEHQPAGSSPD